VRSVLLVLRGGQISDTRAFILNCARHVVGYPNAHRTLFLVPDVRYTECLAERPTGGVERLRLPSPKPTDFRRIAVPSRFFVVCFFFACLFIAVIHVIYTYYFFSCVRDAEGRLLELGKRRWKRGGEVCFQRDGFLNKQWKGVRKRLQTKKRYDWRLFCFSFFLRVACGPFEYVFPCNLFCWAYMQSGRARGVTR
jgi:hypothetical protein